MKKTLRVLAVLVILGTIGWFFLREKPGADFILQTPQGAHKAIAHKEQVVKLESQYEALGVQEMKPTKEFAQQQNGNLELVQGHNQENDTASLGYEIEDDVAVIEGDIVLGEADPGKRYTGPSPSQRIQVWPGGVVPFFIQGDLPNPERVIKAMSYFTQGVSFQPYDGQADVLVFQAGTGNCKSYVGRVGGKQPVWLGPGCGPKEIAHEIMHALGFIHEQNRSDRDSFVSVQWQNISDHARVNFELFPHESMKVSGLGPFDFESIMLYPSTMFSKDGSSETLKSRIEGKSIQPSHKLSSGDLLRLELLGAVK